MSVLEYPLTILNGQTISDVLGPSQLKWAERVVIQAPATQPETVTVQVSFDGTTYAALQTPGPSPADYVTAAGKATTIPFPAWRYLRLVAGAGVGAQRDYSVMISEKPTI